LKLRPHPERKIPGSCGEGFEGDLVAEGLELGNGPTDSHPSWRPPAMRVLSAKYREPLCGRPFSQVALNRRGRS
jgi:hypothetical protein